MPNDAGRAGTPAGVFGAELRFYRTRAGLSQKDLAALAHVSHDVISKIETGERPPAEDFPPRLDALPELGASGALTRLWDHLKKGQKQRLYGWFQGGPTSKPRPRCCAGTSRSSSPACCRPRTTPARSSAPAPTATWTTWTTRWPPGWPARQFWTERPRPSSGASWTRASCTAPSAGPR
jgi:transcriptional regulator with XRE-family HTH domain